MKKISFIILVTLIFLTSFDNKENKENKELLVNSEWVSLWFENCLTELYLYEDYSFKIYNCEQEDWYYGSYWIAKDTLFLETFDSDEYRDYIKRRGDNPGEFFFRTQISYLITDSCLYPQGLFTYNWTKEQYERRSEFVFEYHYTKRK